MTLARYTLVVLGVVGATLGPLALALGPRWTPAERWAAAFGAGLAAANAVAAYALVCWTERRSAQTFLATVLGGMVGRMAVLLAAVVAGILALNLPRLPLAFSLLTYFVVFLVFELTVLQRRTTATEPR